MFCTPHLWMRVEVEYTDHSCSYPEDVCAKAPAFADAFLIPEKAYI